MDKTYQYTQTTHNQQLYYRTSQVDNMRAELPNINNCAAPFLSRAAVDLSCYYYTSNHPLFRMMSITLVKYSLYEVPIILDKVLNIHLTEL